MDKIMSEGLKNRLIIDVVGSFRHKIMVQKNSNNLYTVFLFEPREHEMKVLAEDILEQHMCYLVNYATSEDKEIKQV